MTAGRWGAVLAARDVSKFFGGVRALRGVTFDLRPGEIHALCGENGAGKSTLIKILGGIIPAGSFEGEMEVDGRTVRFGGVADATAAGIGVIHQELALVDELSVAENVWLGAWPRRRGFVDWAGMRGDARGLFDRFGLDLDPERPVRALGMGERQLVEIAKALGRRSRILILDEPTAALSEKETITLLDVLRDLRERGIACVYISHRLDEVFALADRITVLRDGESVAAFTTAEATRQAVVRAMVGREIRDFFPRRARAPGETLLSVKELTVASSSHAPVRLSGVSFDVRAGEVLGVGGLMGAGRTELVSHVFGAWGVRIAGDVLLGGAGLDPGLGPADLLARGLALVSEDRKRLGLVLDADVAFNLVLSILPRLTRHGLLDGDRATLEGRRVFDAVGVRAAGLDAPVAALSGGNQQKVVLGKALLADPRVVLLDEPTRGVDVGAKVEIYEQINRLTDAGKAVVLVSSELPELVGMSDRILVLREGRVAARFERGEATVERVGAAALGAAAA